MINKIREFIKSENLFTEKDSILLAVSGGADSVAMADIFHKMKIKSAIAHCNFKLRGKDSDKDKIFTEKLAKKYNFPFFSIDFDTENHAKENKLSIEESARNLRYEWFEKIRKENKFKYIAVAHHANDNTETFFINLTSGTGIRGLSAMKTKNNFVIRPLLFLQRSDIENYCSENKLEFRTDKSNFETKHTRNKFRHNIIPKFSEINPAFERIMQKNINILNDVEKIYLSAISKFEKSAVRTFENHTKISISEISKTEAPETYLFEVIRKFNFNPTQTHNILSQINGESGKIFLSKTHQLEKSRNYLIISKLKEIKSLNISINSPDFKLTEPVKLSFEVQEINKNFKIETSNKIAYIDFDKIKFPLTIESWQTGDYFYPLGMKGKKNLSKFFTDIKLTQLEKQEVLLLKSENQIVWILEKRLDNRFKINKKTKKVLICKID